MVSHGRNIEWWSSSFAVGVGWTAIPYYNFALKCKVWTDERSNAETERKTAP